MRTDMDDSKLPFERVLGPYGAPLAIIVSLLTLTAQFAESAESVGWRFVAILVVAACIYWCIQVFTAYRTSPIDASVRVGAYSKQVKACSLLLTLVASVPAAIAGYFTFVSMREPKNDVSLALALAPKSTLARSAKKHDLTTRDQLRYDLQRDQLGLTVEPEVGYLDRVDAGGPVTDDDFYSTQIALPNFDLKLVNNTDRTLFFTELILDVTESTVDPWPVLVLGRGYRRRDLMGATITNEGWGEVYDCIFRYNVFVENEGTNNGVDLTLPPYKHEVRIGTFATSKDFDCSNAIGDLGLNLPAMRLLNSIEMTSGSGMNRIYTLRTETGEEVEAPAEEWEKQVKKAVAPFATEHAFVTGELSFSGDTIAGERTHKTLRVKTRIPLVHRDLPAGASTPPSQQYDANLDVDRKDYSKTVFISQALKAHEPDRFYLRLSAAKSSIHTFRIHLRNGEEHIISSPLIRLRLFIPRSAVREIQSSELYDVRDSKIDVIEKAARNLIDLIPDSDDPSAWKAFEERTEKNFKDP